MIGVIGDHAARYTWFSQCLALLDKPDNHIIRWRVGGNQALGRNLLVEDCLKEKCDWLWFIDDDHAFATNTLTQLLSHEQPVVSALVLQRGAPFLPTAYASKNGGEFHNLDLSGVRYGNLVEVRACGTGALLVHTDVFKQLE